MPSTVVTFSGGPKDGSTLDVRDIGAHRPPFTLMIDSENGRRLHYERDNDRTNQYNFVGYKAVPQSKRRISA